MLHISELIEVRYRDSGYRYKGRVLKNPEVILVTSSQIQTPERANAYAQTPEGIHYIHLSQRNLSLIRLADVHEEMDRQLQTDRETLDIRFTV